MRSALTGAYRAYLTHCQIGAGVPSGGPPERVGGRVKPVFYWGPDRTPEKNETVRFDTVRFDTMRSDTRRSDTSRSDTMRSDTACFDTARSVMPPRVHRPASEVWQRGNPP